MKCGKRYIVARCRSLTPAIEEQIGVVNKTLQEINASEKPAILIFNKIDQYEKQTSTNGLTNL